MSAIHCYRHYAAEPFFNMAFDESMLDFVLRHPDIVLLRVYTWQPGAITIGLNQAVEEAVDTARIGTTPLIRRITGGRAVYHDLSELTYSVAVNPEGAGWDVWRGSISEVYLYLAKALQSFLTELGVGSRVVRSSSEPARSPGEASRQPCFESAARYELLATGGKVVASAQRRVGQALLQHGSIKLDGIARHDALRSVRDHGSHVQPIGKLRFDELSTVFFETWGSVLGGVIESDPPALEGSQVLQNRLERVTKEPLQRRDSFEQTGGSKSL